MTSSACTSMVIAVLSRRRSRILSGASAFAGGTGRGPITCRSYVWSASVAHDLVVAARTGLQLKPTQKTGGDPDGYHVDAADPYGADCGPGRGVSRTALHR